MTELLAGKVVRVIDRHRDAAVVIEFTDGTRSFVDHAPDGFEFSVTEGEPAD